MGWGLASRAVNSSVLYLLHFLSGDMVIPARVPYIYYRFPCPRARCVACPIVNGRWRKTPHSDVTWAAHLPHVFKY